MSALRLRNAVRNGPVGTAGLLVCFADDPAKPLLLGASHVFAPAGAQPGDPLLDPLSGRAMATLLDWTGLLPGTGFPNQADAALAVPLLDLAGGLAGLDRRVFADARPSPGEPIRTVAADVVLEGVVEDPSRECAIPWQDPATQTVYRFGLSDQIICSPLHRPGDSGAAALTASGLVVGLVVGAPAPELGDGIACSVLSPIATIARHPAWDGRVLRPFGLDQDGRPAEPGAPDANRRAVDVMARTMWGEARGEALTLMHDSLAAVGAVVMNRLAAGRPRSWGGTVEQVCRKDWQFSCWNAGDPNLPQLRRVDAGNQVFAVALGIAADTIAGRVPDPTCGATHYHDKRMVPPPYWARGLVPCRTIGNHAFYNSVP